VAERRARAVSAALALAAVVVSGCGMTHDFVPVTPTRVVAPAAELELRDVSESRGLMVTVPDGYATSHGTTVRLRWHAGEEGTGLARAFLVPPEAAPCTLGLLAELIDIDGQVRWDRPVGLGVAHDVTLSFPGAPRLAEGPLALDVEIAGARGTSCVRLPVSEASRPLVPASRVVFGGGLSVAGPLRAHSGSFVQVDVLGGRWFGPVSVGLRLGLGFDSKIVIANGGNDAGGAQSPDPRFVTLSLAPELKVFPFVRATRAIGIALSLELGDAMSGAGTAASPDRDDVYWGPRLGVVFASLEPVPLGAQTRRGRGGHGVEVALARFNLSPGEPSRGAAWLLSAGVTSW
jgi:hypothetical protein